MPISHKGSFNGHISPYPVQQTGDVLSWHEVFADFNRMTFHRSQVVQCVSGIMGMTCSKEERGHLFDSIEMEWPICLSLSSNVLEDDEDWFDQAIHPKLWCLPSTEMASTSSSRSSMLWKLFFPKRGHNSSSTSTLRALTCFGNFLPLSIFSTTPKATLSISTIPVSAISVPMQPQ